jgi:hypothetical protein
VKTLLGGLLKTCEYLIQMQSVFACKTLIPLQSVIAIAQEQLPILIRWLSGISKVLHTQLSCLSCACRRVPELFKSLAIVSKTYLDLATSDKETEPQYTHMPKKVLHRIKRKNYFKRMIEKPFDRIERLIKNRKEYEVVWYHRRILLYPDCRN